MTKEKILTYMQDHITGTIQGYPVCYNPYNTMDYNTPRESCSLSWCVLSKPRIYPIVLATFNSIGVMEIMMGGTYEETPNP